MESLVPALQHVLIKGHIMPCMGPSKDHAFKQGEEIYEELMKLLSEKYNIYNMGESMRKYMEEHPEKFEEPNNIQRFMNGFNKRMEEEYIRNCEDLKAAIQELVWTFDAWSF